METILLLIVISLGIGVSCTILLYLHEKRPYMEQKYYNYLSVVSFIFNMTGSFLCIYTLYYANT